MKRDYRTLFRTMSGEWAWILSHTKNYKWQVLLYFFFGVSSSALSLAAPVMMKYLIDAVQYRKSDELLRDILLVAGFSLFQLLFGSLASRVTTVVGSRITLKLRSDIYSRIVSARCEDISGYHSGELLNRLEGDVATVSGGIIAFVPSAFTKLLTFAGAFFIVLYNDNVMALIALAGAPFMFLSSRFLIKTMRKYNVQSREMNGKVLGYAEESVQNLYTIKSFDLTKRYIGGMSELLKKAREVTLNYDKFNILLGLAMSVVGLLVSFCCYGWGIYRLWTDTITFGTMTLFIQLAGYLSSSFSGLASLVPSAIKTATSAGRIIEITGLETETDADAEVCERLKKAAKKHIGITAENVGFTYKDGDSPVLDSFNLTAKSGEIIGIVGPSGEGKTTVLKLILGLVSPSGGSLTLTVNDETVNISDSTRRFCSYVPQGGSVFSGTIAENLRLAKPGATDEELENALEVADLLGFVKSLPDGLNSRTGEGGANLSQGQAQRVAIARAVLRDAEILLLDEATSALDKETESRVLGRLMHRSPDKIIILTTHRDSMLTYCDKIIKIE